MDLQITPLRETFAAEVRGLDIAAGPTDEMCEAVYAALLDYGVLVLPDQPLTDAQQEAFCAWYGELEPNFYDPDRATAALSNLADEDGALRDPESRQSTFLRANQLWHSDSTIFQAPARVSFLSARIVPPEGGETEWCDTQGAWDALPPERQAELDGLVVEHDFQNSRRKMGHTLSDSDRERWPPLPHPLVRVHEDTGRKALYVGSQAVTVIGWPEDKGAALIEELLAHATQPRFVYTHHWSVNDFVIWDNRRVNHRGRPWDEAKYARALHRCTTKGAIPTVVDGRPVNEYEEARRLAHAGAAE